MPQEASQFTLPLNGPELITPLEAFRDGLEDIFEGHSKAVFGVSEKDDISFANGTLHVSDETAEHPETSHVSFWMWLPKATIEKPYEMSTNFILIDGYFTKLFAHGDSRTELREESKFRLGYEQQAKGKRVSLFAEREEDVLRERHTESEVYRSGSPSEKHTGIRSVTELNQRLRWALDMVSRLADKVDETTA